MDGKTVWWCWWIFLPGFAVSLGTMRMAMDELVLVRMHTVLTDNLRRGKI
jgi:hypothetical protein